jgi:hypothetical protein
MRLYKSTFQLFYRLPSLHFRRVSGNTWELGIVTRTIILKAPQNEKIEIASIETPDPAITTQVQALGDFGVRVTLGNIIPKGDLDSKFVVVRLASAQVVEITFKIRFAANFNKLRSQ